MGPLSPSFDVPRPLLRRLFAPATRRTYMMCVSWELSPSRTIYHSLPRLATGTSSQVFWFSTPQPNALCFSPQGLAPSGLVPAIHASHWPPAPALQFSCTQSPRISPVMAAYVISELHCATRPQNPPASALACCMVSQVPILLPQKHFR